MNRFGRGKKLAEGPTSTIHVVLVGAKDLIAADKGGTSDPYAIAELVDAASKKSLRPKRVKKTATIKKTLEPTWDEFIEWEGLEGDPSSLALNVKVYDADMLSSEVLGEITLSVSDFPVKEMLDKWYPLQISGKMKEVKGEVRIQTRIDIPPDEDEEMARAAEMKAVKDERIIGKHGCKYRKAIKVKDAMISNLCLYLLIEALLFAILFFYTVKLWKPSGVQRDVDPEVLDTGWELYYDKPYTHATSRKDLRGIPLEARFVLICAKMAEYRNLTLCAIGERGAVVNERDDESCMRSNGVYWYWKRNYSFGFSPTPEVNLGRGPDYHDCFKPDPTSNERLSWNINNGFGGWRAGYTTRIHVNPETGHAWRKLIYYFIDPNWDGKTDYVLAGSSEGSSTQKVGPVTLHISVIEAKDLIAADKGGTSDPFATCELVDSKSGKSLKPKKSKKTKKIKKTLTPVWNETIKWEGIKQDPASLNLSIKVADADMLSSEPLGEISLLVAKFPTTPEPMDAWYNLKVSAGMSSVKGSIHVQTRMEYENLDKGEEEVRGDDV